MNDVILFIVSNHTLIILHKVTYTLPIENKQEVIKQPFSVFYCK